MCMTGLAGCGSEKRADGKTEIEVVSYKPEAVKAFEKIEKQFNETHDDIHLTISSPNEAMTILKTRFIREDYPDIIAIGGDINYSNFLDADLFDDISDLDEVQTVKQAYLDMDKELEFIPKDGTYALPYVANAAGILYNKDLFEQAGIEEVPTTFDQWTEAAEKISALSTADNPIYGSGLFYCYNGQNQSVIQRFGTDYMITGNEEDGFEANLLDNQAFADAMIWMKNLYDNGYNPQETDIDSMMAACLLYTSPSPRDTR